MVNLDKWDVCPDSWNKNFRCWISDAGLWRLENGLEFGKSVFNIERIGEHTAPTFADQRNFFTGLLEAEWRNDNFVFKNGTSRPPQREKKIIMFKEILEEISERADVKDTPRGVDFYLSKCSN